MTSTDLLSIHKLVALIQSGGILSAAIKDFEVREQQQKMLSNVVEAYNKNAISLIEAGTGTGKSVAYLIPALIWALQQNERTVVSTNTIALQEQLLNKDIPLLTKALNLEIKAVLVKGMANYVCLRKLEELSGINTFAEKEIEELNYIEAWKNKTLDGSKSDLPFVPSYNVWDQICAESDTCNYVKCPHYKNCFFFKAREHAADAHLLIANHNLLFTDLASRFDNNNYEEPNILPSYKRIIIDEAHHVEDIATEHFSLRTSRIAMIKILAKLSSDRSGQNGKLHIFKQKINEIFGKHPPAATQAIIQRLNIELPALRQELLGCLNNTFSNLDQFAQSFAQRSKSEDFAEEQKLRLMPSHLEHPMWKNEIQASVKLLQETVNKYILSLKGLDDAVEALKDGKLSDQTRNLRFDIKSLATRLENAAATLHHFVLSEHSPTNVRWIELQPLKTAINTHVITADLDVSQRLVKALFDPFPTVVLCSATLATNKKFDYIRQRLGIKSDLLPNKLLEENLYDSPFDYQKQAMLVVPSDAPNPSDPNFLPSAIENIWRSIQASRGNAFVLFTSYSMLDLIYKQLSARLKEHRYHALKQGEETRQTLLDKFKGTDRSVLFGTDSFWEGVDVVGEALRCVIIVKLPFRVPSEPIVEARTEAIVSRGGEPFIEYAIPQAIVKFKQGFGRLIRNKRDRGCIVCLDPRIITKRYGKMFINSLPDCGQLFVAGNKLQSEMEAFYRKTYGITKEDRTVIWDQSESKENWSVTESNR